MSGTTLPIRESARLEFPGEDVQALQSVLEAQGYRTLTLVDAQATREAVRGAIRTVAELLDGRDSTLLFHFSGHGWAPDRRNILATYDAGAANLTSSGLAVDELVEMLKATRARRRVVWIDACRNEPGARGPAGRSWEKFGRSEGTRILFSTGVGKVSFENPALRRGVFTHFLVEALKGAAAGSDGLVTFRDIADYVTDRLEGWSLQTGQVQVPYEVADEVSGDFLVSALPARPPSPAENLSPAVESGKAGSTGSSTTNVINFDMGIAPLDADQAKALGLGDDQPLVQVTSLTPGGWAERVGLRTGDVIKSINRVSIRSTADVLSLRGSLNQGGEVVFRVVRPDGGKKPPQALFLAGRAGEASSSAVTFGFGFVELDAEQRKLLALEDDRGVKVTSVANGGLGDDVGLQLGDVIVSINRRTIVAVEDVFAIRLSFKPGDAVAFRVLRKTAEKWNGLYLSGTLPLP